LGRYRVETKKSSRDAIRKDTGGWDSGTNERITIVNPVRHVLKRLSKETSKHIHVEKRGCRNR